jgi:hypothetical protein
MKKVEEYKFIQTWWNIIPLYVIEKRTHVIDRSLWRFNFGCHRIDGLFIIRGVLKKCLTIRRIDELYGCIDIPYGRKHYRICIATSKNPALCPVGIANGFYQKENRLFYSIERIHKKYGTGYKIH